MSETPAKPALSARLRHAPTALVAVAALLPSLALDLPKGVEAAGAVVLVVGAAYGIYPPRKDPK